MTIAKCFKCGGSAISDTFEQARKLINHAVGLSRGIKCGDSYNCVTEIKSEGNPKPEISKQVIRKPVIRDRSRPIPEKPKPIIETPKTAERPIPEERPELQKTDTSEKPKPIIETPKTEPQKTATPEKPKQKNTRK